MRFTTRIRTFFGNFRVRYRRAERYGIWQTCSLIRREAREKMRSRPGPSKRGSPPHAHTRTGLKEINFHVEQNSRGIVGPRRFKGSKFFNRPVPNIHEIGGVAVGTAFRRRQIARYPERSFMWSAVKRLQSKGKISSTFAVSVRSTLN